jgi:hypothetical protein
MKDIPVHFQKQMELQKRGKPSFCGAENHQLLRTYNNKNQTNNRLTCLFYSKNMA